MRRTFLVTVMSMLIACFAFGTQNPNKANPQKEKPTATTHANKGVEQELTQLEREWSNAMVKGDASAIERIEAGDFMFTAPDGTTNDKSQDVNDLKSGTFKAQSFDLSDLRVRTYGDTAVVTGTNDLKATYKGKDISGKYRFTDVFVKRNGRWQAVASQASPLGNPQQKAE